MVDVVRSRTVYTTFFMKFVVRLIMFTDMYTTLAFHRILISLYLKGITRMLGHLGRQFVTKRLSNDCCYFVRFDRKSEFTRTTGK